jgi:hypothetical protein
LRPILEDARQLVLKYRIALGVEVDSSSASDSCKSSQDDTGSDEAETSSDDGSDGESGQTSSNDSDYHPKGGNDEREEESLSDAKDSAAEHGDIGSGKDDDRCDAGPSASTETPALIQEETLPAFECPVQRAISE